MTVTWDRIDQTFVHGVLLGYRVSCGKHNERGDLVWNNETLSPRETSLVLKGLQKFTYYTIVLCAFTSKGCGVLSREITVRTREDGMSKESLNIQKFLNINFPEFSYLHILFPPFQSPACLRRTSEYWT